MHFLLVAVGGALGAAMRHGVNLLALRWFGPAFPWGTLAVNVLGSFVMGLMVELIARKLGASPEWRLFAATGLLGGFTTFSAFSLDVVVLWERGQMTMAATYVMASVILAIAALFAGLVLGRTLV